MRKQRSLLCEAEGGAHPPKPKPKGKGKGKAKA
jgi:hypothetical protein